MTHRELLIQRAEKLLKADLEANNGYPVNAPYKLHDGAGNHYKADVKMKLDEYVMLVSTVPCCVGMSYMTAKPELTTAPLPNPLDMEI